MHPIHLEQRPQRRRLTTTLLAISAVLAVATLGCARGEAAEAAKREPGFLDRLLDRPVVVEVPGGTVLAVRLLDGVSSQASRPGDSVRARVEQDVRLDGRVAIPAGAELRGTVADAHPVRRIGGRARLAVRFHDLRLPSGESAAVDAGFSRVARRETPRDAATIAGGALVGAIVGHQVDDDDEGKVVGGLAGAGVGAAIAARTRGERIELPAGTALRLKLRAPAAVEVRG
jgi:hypothetical protein